MLARTRLLTVLAVLFAAVVLVPSAQASIQPPPTPLSMPGYTGWGTLRDTSCDYRWNCPAPAYYVGAYAWTYYGWRQVPIRVGTQVYVTPYVSAYGRLLDTQWTWVYVGNVRYLVRSITVATTNRW